MIRKGKLIIIEGADGTGKTALIEGLKRTISPDYIFNFSYPKESEMFQNGAFARGEYTASIRIFKQLLAKGNVIVCDRFHIGEFAYGPVMRGYPEWFAREIMEKIEAFMLEEIKRENIYLVILTCLSTDSLIKRIKDFKRQYPKVEDLHAINQRYRYCFTRLNVIGMDTDNDIYNGKPEKVLNRVIDFIMDGDSK